MLVRKELARDKKRISSVIAAAFAGHAHSDGREAAIVDALRAAGALALSLIAEVDGKVIGQAAFSPVRMLAEGESLGGWYGLGPVAVLPEHQNKGIGDAMIRQGLEMLEVSGARGCVVLGEPDYYSRFGFRAAPQAFYCEGVPQEYFMALAFGNSAAIPHCRVEYHPSFFG